MPALNFHKTFAEAVRIGAKAQTIRAPRKRPIRELDTLYLYTGMQTKSCQKLGEVRCTAVKDLVITPNTLTVDGHAVGDLEEFALADGFDSWADLVEYVKGMGFGQLPFRGDLIEWRPPPIGDVLEAQHGQSND